MTGTDEYDINTAFKARVKKNKLLTPTDLPSEVRQIILEFEGNELGVDAGDSIGVVVPGHREPGRKHYVRLYSVDEVSEDKNDIKPTTSIGLCVRRCFFIDERSGKEHKGIASNYLCNLKRGDEVSLIGPFGYPFEMPEDKTSNLLMICLGTGIAPFRVFIKQIQNRVGEWKGKFQLFHGGHTGLELLYRNDQMEDFPYYYDSDTFKAFEEINPRHYWGGPITVDAPQQNVKEAWEMILDPKTYVYVAGLGKVLKMLDKLLSEMADSEDEWRKMKEELVVKKRWFEVIYQP